MVAPSCCDQVRPINGFVGRVVRIYDWRLSLSKFGSCEGACSACGIEKRRGLQVSRRGAFVKLVSSQQLAPVGVAALVKVPYERSLAKGPQGVPLWRRFGK